MMNVMFDFVSNIQTRVNHLDWSSMNKELDAIRSSSDSLSIEVNHQFVMDLLDF